MLEDFVNDKISEVSKAVKKYRGTDVSEEQADAVQNEITTALKKLPEEKSVTLEQVLRLYIPFFYPDRDPDGPKYFDSFDMAPIHIYITAPNYKPVNPYPLMMRTFELVGKNPEEVKIKNLRRFLADYQESTHTWIGAKDILNASVKQIYTKYSGRYKYGHDAIVLICELS